MNFLYEIIVYVLFFWVILRLIIAIYNGCKGYRINWAINYIKASLFLDLFILIADTLLIRGIIRKMNNMYSGLKEYVPVTYQIESNLKKADSCILCDMLLNLVQLVRAFKAYITDDTSDSQVNCEICNIKENNCNNNYNNNDDNNQVNAYTTRTMQIW